MAAKLKQTKPSEIKRLMLDLYDTNLDIEGGVRGCWSYCWSSSDEHKEQNKKLKEDFGEDVLASIEEISQYKKATLKEMF